VIDDEEIALEAEGRVGGEHDDAVGGRDHRGARAGCDVHARMVAARLAAIDALRAEPAADAAAGGPDEGVAPALRVGAPATGGDDAGELALAAAHEFGGRAAGAPRDADMLDPPLATRDGDVVNDDLAVGADHLEMRAGP